MLARSVLCVLLMCACDGEAPDADGGGRGDDAAAAPDDAAAHLDAAVHIDAAVRDGGRHDAAPEPDAGRQLDAALDGGRCERRCAARTCGDDGCGGSCGACRANERCDAGGCAPDGVYFVAPSGDDADPGTRDRPFGTLAHALSVLVAGDRLWLRGGEYREVVDVPLARGTEAARIVVAAYDGERPVVRGRLVLRRPYHWTFSGVNVTRDSATSGDGDLLHLRDGRGWVFRDAEIWNARGYAAATIGGGRAYDAEPSGWRFLGNCVHDNGAVHGPDQDHDVYMNFGDRGRDGFFERNVIWGAPNGTNVKVGAGDPTHPDPRGVVMRFNTFHDARYNVRLVDGSASIVLRRNLFSRATQAWPSVTQNVQGYCLYGTGNALLENLGGGADAFDSYYEPGASPSCRVPAGRSFTRPTRRDVRFPVSPGFDRTDACDGFRPSGAAEAYGRWASLDDAVVGDWDGDGADGPGAMMGNSWYLRDDASAGGHDHVFEWARASDAHLAGDLDGDGVDEAVAVRDGTWFVRGGGSFDFGAAGDQFVLGDWDGDGVDTAGYVRDRTVHLRDDRGRVTSFRYGSAGDRYVAGDWDGDGVDTVGVVRGNLVHLRNTNSAGPADVSYAFGSSGDVHVFGDWDGDGVDTVGVVRGVTWLLRDPPGGGAATRTFDYDG
ncbi:MAG: hypothetical protein SangKO_005320 [Sandaracinaceae bacterium]